MQPFGADEHSGVRKVGTDDCMKFALGTGVPPADCGQDARAPRVGKANQNLTVVSIDVNIRKTPVTPVQPACSALIMRVFH